MMRVIGEEKEPKRSVVVEAILVTKLSGSAMSVSMFVGMFGPTRVGGPLCPRR